MPTKRHHLIFSYGTLQRADIQRAHFGRLLEGEEDLLPCCRIVPEKILDAEIADTLGIRYYDDLVFTGDPTDQVRGMLFRISDTELTAADAYEAPEYARFETVLKSGRRAWVYATTKTAMTRKA